MFVILLLSFIIGIGPSRPPQAPINNPLLHHPHANPPHWLL